ncbi:MAG: hypothetical protein LC799_35760, partial [Actinobacteria bacterium]|nr:hypothetical protein [Actinomycetota bacterium]
VSTPPSAIRPPTRTTAVANPRRILCLTRNPRQGRPYTLVLTKTDELFTRATNARRKAVTDLAWLTSTLG